MDIPADPRLVEYPGPVFRVYSGQVGPGIRAKEPENKQAGVIQNGPEARMDVTGMF